MGVPTRTPDSELDDTGERLGWDPADMNGTG